MEDYISYREGYGKMGIKLSEDTSPNWPLHNGFNRLVDAFLELICLSAQPEDPLAGNERKDGIAGENTNIHTLA